MSLLLRPSKSASPFLFWRSKRSTKIEPTGPTSPPLRIKVMNRSESDVFYASYTCPDSVKSVDIDSCSSNDTSGLEKSASQVSTLTDSHKENDSTTCCEPSEAQTTTAEYYEQSEASVEVPIEQAELLLETKPSFHEQQQHSPSTTAQATTATAMTASTMTPPAPVAAAAAPVSPDLARVPSNLEILEDLRSKLLSEKLKRRVAELAASHETPIAESKMEPDDSLIKPPKKLPTKSFIEYRRDLFKCNDKYAEEDPPGQLVPGETIKDTEEDNDDVSTVFTLLGSESVSTTRYDGVKRPDPDDTPTVMEEYPKPLIPRVPLEAKSGEDVAMHEILTAINMFVAPEYEIHNTPALPESESSILATMDSFSDCFGASGLPPSATYVGEPRDRMMRIEKCRSNDTYDDDEEAPASFGVDAIIENEPPLEGKLPTNNSPVGVHELESSATPRTRSRSMDFALDQGRDDERPEDEQSDSATKYQLQPAGYSSLSRQGSHDESSPIKRCVSEGLLKPRETALKSNSEKEYGRSVRFQFQDTPVARKIDFGDEDSKDEDVDDDESGYEEADNDRYRKEGQYVAFKEDKNDRAEKTENDGPSVATNLQEVWYDCAYLFDVVSEEFWSGLLGEDEYDAASINASTMDGNSLDGSTADSLITEEDEQYILNRKRQKMWRTYRRKLQLAKKEADV